MATIEDLRAKIGQEVGVSDWLTVDQTMIDRFADATLDRQFIHVDPERARASPFGGTIAHGFLSLSLLTTLVGNSGAPRPDGATMEINYGLNKVRFLTPVPCDARVRGRFRLVDFIEKRAGQFQQTVEATVEIEGKDKPALIAEWIVQFLA